MHTIFFCIMHLLNFVSSCHGCYLLSKSCFWFSRIFCIHTASLAWSLFDTSQERCKTTCSPSDAKQSPTVRALVSKIKVSLLGNRKYLWQEFFLGGGVIIINTGVGWRIPPECVFPEAPSKNMYLVQFSCSANYFFADLGLFSLLKILNQQS